MGYKQISEGQSNIKRIVLSERYGIYSTYGLEGHHQILMFYQN